MNKIVSLVLILALVSCKDETPGGVLKKDQMQSLYWDLMRADEMVNYYASADTSYNRQRSQDSLYTIILLAHKISRDEFLKSKTYYEEHPELLKPVLDSMFTQGERSQNLLLVNVEKMSGKPDSIPKNSSSDTSPNRKGLILKPE